MGRALSETLLRVQTRGSYYPPGAIDTRRISSLSRVEFSGSKAEGEDAHAEEEASGLVCRVRSRGKGLRENMSMESSSLNKGIVQRGKETTGSISIEDKK